MPRTRPWVAVAALCATMPLLAACTPANLMPGANQATPEQTAEQVLQALQTGDYPAVGAHVTNTEYVHPITPDTPVTGGKVMGVARMSDTAAQAQVTYTVSGTPTNATWDLVKQEDGRWTIPAEQVYATVRFDQSFREELDGPAASIEQGYEVNGHEAEVDDMWRLLTGVYTMASDNDWNRGEWKAALDVDAYNHRTPITSADAPYTHLELADGYQNNKVLQGLVRDAISQTQPCEPLVLWLEAAYNEPPRYAESPSRGGLLTVDRCLMGVTDVTGVDITMADDGVDPDRRTITVNATATGTGMRAKAWKVFDQDKEWFPALTYLNSMSEEDQKNTQCHVGYNSTDNTSPMVCATFAPIPFTIKDIPVTIDVGTNHAQADVGNVLKELMGDTPQPNA